MVLNGRDHPSFLLEPFSGAENLRACLALFSHAMVGTVTPVEEVADKEVADDQAKHLIPPDTSRSPHSDDDEHEIVATKSRKQTGLFQFANVEAIKEKVRKAKNPKNQYNVHNMYHTTGFFQRIARHYLFENITLGVIVLNAIYIGIDTNYNKPKSDHKDDECSPWCGWGFLLGDLLFFIYFTTEVLIRFLAFKRKASCLKDGWFVFDSILVLLYAFDPFAIGIAIEANGGGELDLPTSVLRLFRLARLSRLVRMLRSLPELMILIKGMVSALRPALSALSLLFIITYVFAIAFVNFFPSDHRFRVGPIPTEELGFFYNVPHAMHSLIVFATFLDDLSMFVYPIKEESVLYLIPVFAYIVLSNMVVFNMLIAVMCAVITGVAIEEKESMIIDKVHEKFGHVVTQLDTNMDSLLSWEEFEKIVSIPEAIAALESVNVDPEALIDAAEDFFLEDGQYVSVTFEEFMTMVLDMRGGQQAAVKDIMSVSKRFTKKFLRVQSRMDELEHKADLILDKLGVSSPDYRPKGSSGNSLLVSSQSTPKK